MGAILLFLLELLEAAVELLLLFVEPSSLARFGARVDSCATLCWGVCGGVPWVAIGGIDDIRGTNGSVVSADVGASTGLLANCTLLLVLLLTFVLVLGLTNTGSDAGSVAVFVPMLSGVVLFPTVLVGLWLTITGGRIDSVYCVPSSPLSKIITEQKPSVDVINKLLPSGDHVRSVKVE